MSKDKYSTAIIAKHQCAQLLADYHYLSGISRGFKSGFNVGLILDGEVVGVCIFTGWPVPELLHGCFGLPRNDQDGFWELSRLVLRPDVQASEHNLASWFVSRSIARLKSEMKPRCVLSYADCGFHQGTIYAACNFKYYGLSASKKDFWFKQQDGSFVKHSRGPVKGFDGEWRERNRKHRFLMNFDKSIQCKWIEQKWRTTNDTARV